MIVDLVSLLTSLHTNPTDMRFASQTLHMSATTILLDRRATSWTILCVSFLLPSFESFITLGSILVLFAGQTFVAGGAAGGAN